MDFFSNVICIVTAWRLKNKCFRDDQLQQVGGTRFDIAPAPKTLAGSVRLREGTQTTSWLEHTTTHPHAILPDRERYLLGGRSFLASEPAKASRALWSFLTVLCSSKHTLLIWNYSGCITIVQEVCLICEFCWLRTNILASARVLSRAVQSLNSRVPTSPIRSRRCVIGSIQFWMRWSCVGAPKWPAASSRNRVHFTRTWVSLFCYRQLSNL